jgi:hypothetical protein
MCLDCRALNSITRKNAAPLPRIDDLLDRMVGAKYFSALDLAQGYYQMEIHPRDKEKTAFKTVSGLYQFNTLTMGLTNAPSVFQTMMNQTFGILINNCVLIYLDDILVYSKTEEEHIEHIERSKRKLQPQGW